MPEFLKEQTELLKSRFLSKVLFNFVPCIICHGSGFRTKIKRLFLPIHHVFFLLLFLSMLDAIIQGHTHNTSYITLRAPVFNCFSQLCETIFVRVSCKWPKKKWVEVSGQEIKYFKK